MKPLKNCDLKEFLNNHPDPDEAFPRLSSLSSGFFFNFLPNPKERMPLELIEIQIPEKAFAKTFGAMVSWNAGWEAGQFRPQICLRDLPEKWKKFLDNDERNIYLIPKYEKHSYGKLAILHHLLPFEIIKKYNLPFVENANWPMLSSFGDSKILDPNYDEKIQSAFAEYIWPHLNTRSSLSSFSKDDPISILAHNPDYWIGPAFNYVESEILKFDFVEKTTVDDKEAFKKAAKHNYEDVDICLPRFGGPVWRGKAEAQVALKKIVDSADKHGRLREILDMVQSNRIQDDFSSRWSYEKEDFERKLYSKRNKVRVTFVELEDTIPVISPSSEVHEHLMWEDFMALLDHKEKKITVCLRNGETKLKDIADELGYANHSPVSKALERIRNKANHYFENSR